MKGNFYFICILILILAFFCSCTTIGDPLVGEFSPEKNGSAIFKITKKDSQYFIVMKSDKSWSQPEKLQTLSEKDLTGIFGQKYRDFVVSGVGGGEGFMILHVKRGATLGGTTFESDYFLLSLLARGSLYKVN